MPMVIRECVCGALFIESTGVKQGGQLFCWEDCPAMQQHLLREASRRSRQAEQLQKASLDAYLATNVHEARDALTRYLTFSTALGSPP